ncbi:MAG: hypothetical protein NTX53_05135 [candidate division WOR-3 bacterium]|nr:hypothetical protein [candidate division WOR-3 bacterium]
MNDEKDRVLKLLEEKKITAEEAARLLDAIGHSDGGNRRNRFLKVRVFDRNSDQAKVNVTLPIGLVKWGMNFMPDSAKAKIEEQEIDMKLITDALERDITGKIVDVEDDEKGQHVEVWLE